MYLGAVISVMAETRLRPIFIVTVFIMVVLVIMPPLYATDIFYYAISGQIAGQFGANPYLYAPAAFPQSQFLPYNFWVNITSPYGPLWTLVCSGISFAGRGDPLITTLLFKLIAAGAIFTASWIIKRLLQDIQPEQANKGLIIFLWNPVVLLDGISNGHNDALIVAFVLLTMLLLYKNRATLGYVPLILATWLKYLTAPLAVFYFLARLRPPAGRRYPNLVKGGVLMAILISFTVLLWMPYWAGLKTLSSLLIETTRGLSGPIPFLISLVGKFFLQNEALANIALTTFIVALSLSAAWVIKQVIKSWCASAGYYFKDELTTAATILALTPVLLPRAHPWFLLPSLGLFAVAHPFAKRRTVLVYVLTILWFLYRVGSW